MDDLGKILTGLLREAADGRSGAAEKFFEALLASEDFVPVQGDKLPLPAGVSDIGTGVAHLKDYGFVLLHYQGAEVLPIFTEEEFVHEWSAEGPVGVERREFKTLLWLLGDEMWMYLNPSQEIGKELTPWEVKQLRDGVEAVPDLAAALREDSQDELTVNSSSDLYPEFKKKILPVLEIYPELQEAFLVEIKESEDDAEGRPALGIKYSGITEAKKIYLRGEIEETSGDFLPRNKQLMLVDDLANPNCGDWRLFAEATPFYISSRPAPQPKKSRVSRMFKGVKKILGKSASD